MVSRVEVSRAGVVGGFEELEGVSTGAHVGALSLSNQVQTERRVLLGSLYKI